MQFANEQGKVKQHCAEVAERTFELRKCQILIEQMEKTSIEQQREVEWSKNRCQSLQVQNEELKSRIQEAETELMELELFLRQFCSQNFEPNTLDELSQSNIGPEFAHLKLFAFY